MLPCRIILDTNVCLDLFVFQDIRSHELKQMLKNRVVHAVTREDCHYEWLRILAAPPLPLNDICRKRCMAEYDAVISCQHFEKRNYVALPVCKDKDDQKFLELAHDAHARFLITKDKALLKLSVKTKQLRLFDIIKPEQSHLISAALKPI